MAERRKNVDAENQIRNIGMGVQRCAPYQLNRIQDGMLLLDRQSVTSCVNIFPLGFEDLDANSHINQVPCHTFHTQLHTTAHNHNEWSQVQVWKLRI